MKKALSIVHWCLFGLNLVLLIGSLIFYLSKWSSLPAEIGMHFSPDGNFDVIASKWYGFYPHIIDGLITLGITIANIVISKRKTGLRITPAGEELFKAEFRLTLDVFLLMWGYYFAMWTRSVSLQIPMNAHLNGKVITAAFGIIMIGILAQIITCLKCRDKQPAAKDPSLRSRGDRLISWLLTLGDILILTECWARFPGDPELYANPDYYGLAYFANFGTYLDKHFLLIAPAVTILMLTAFEFAAFRAKKSGKQALCRLLEKCRLLCAVYCFCAHITLCSEEALDPLNLIPFVIAFIIFLVQYHFRLKQENAAE